jgi:acetolactate synthase-1/2/3 large subunit
VKAYEAMGHALKHEGVSAVFGLMGDGNLSLIPFIADELGIAYYNSRHEAGAVAMADGFARVTGRVGVCTFTQGPGLTNALTALVSAKRGRTPLVVLCGDTPTSISGLPQDIDQAPIFEAFAFAVQPFEPSRAGEAITSAFRRARAERTPVILNLPTDLQELAAEWAAPPAESVIALEAVGATNLDDAISALQAAARPVFISGRGALLSGAHQEIVALADHVGALLANSLPVKSWFAGHDWEIGIAGGFSSELGRQLIGEADCIVSFGASLNHFTSRGGALFASSATVIQIDLDDAAFDRYYPASIHVLGDARQVAQLLREAVRQSDGYRTKRVAGAIEESRADVGNRDADELDAIDPRLLSRALDRILPRDRAVVIDGGHFMGFAAMHLSVPEPSQFVFTVDFGSIGLSIGAAIGAAVGRPDQLIVTAVGDGGLLMSLGEFDTAVRYRLPIVFVVYNDEAYGAEMHFLRMLGRPDRESLFSVPPLDVVARALGGEGMAVGTLADLEPLAERLRTLDGPILLDCRISRDVRAVWLAEAFERGTH